MANVRLANTANQAACNAVVDLIDSGGAGTIELRTGTQPSDADDAATGTLLATLTFSATAFGAASTSGVATAATITSDTDADDTGVATWARIKNGSGNTVFDCDVSTSAAGTGTIQLDDTSIVAGGTVSISAFTITHPDGT